MNSERLKTIADFIDKDDIVLDVGCDHGYLDIFLKENNLCKKVYASDISVKALESANNNFAKKNLNINTFLSDGFKNIPVLFNTAVIAGVGTNTIIKILSFGKNPKKLILDSHNELYKLRLFLNNHNYKIIKEKVVYEKNHYYTIIMCLEGKQKLNEKELKFGISDNYDYYNYLLNKYINICKRANINKKEELTKDISILEGIIEKK